MRFLAFFGIVLVCVVSVSATDVVFPSAGGSGNSSNSSLWQNIGTDYIEPKNDKWVSVNGTFNITAEGWLGEARIGAMNNFLGCSTVDSIFEICRDDAYNISDFAPIMSLDAAYSEGASVARALNFNVDIVNGDTTTPGANQVMVGTITDKGTSTTSRFTEAVSMDYTKSGVQDGYGYFIDMFMAEATLADAGSHQTTDITYSGYNSILPDGTFRSAGNKNFALFETGSAATLLLGSNMTIYQYYAGATALNFGNGWVNNWAFYADQGLPSYFSGNVTVVDVFNASGEIYGSEFSFETRGSRLNSNKFATHGDHVCTGTACYETASDGSLLDIQIDGYLVPSISTCSVNATVRIDNNYEASCTISVSMVTGHFSNNCEFPRFQHTWTSGADLSVYLINSGCSTSTNAGITVRGLYNGR